jgi:uncharacterized protein (UPF0332 family)
MTNEEQNSLVKLRLEQAEETYEAAELLLANSKYGAALNRIYYGMFYAVSALGIKYGFETSKHAKLLGWFNKEFVNVGLIDVKFGRIVRDAFEKRIKADYDTTPLPSNEVIESLFLDMRLFIDEMKRFIQTHP